LKKIYQLYDSKNHKNCKIGILLWHAQAFKLVNIEQRDSILNLGANSGDELEPIKEITGKERFQQLCITGIDFCQSAIDMAKQNTLVLTFCVKISTI